MTRTLKPKVFREKIRGEKMHTCFTCGKKYTHAVIKFHSGHTEPEEDETLTGATSGHTGVVVDSVVTEGSWFDNDAVGYVEISSVTGIDEGDVFEGDEVIDGSVGGANLFKVTHGTEKSYGTMYPLSYLVKYKGKWYCKEHYLAHKKADELTEGNYDFGPSESERGKLP